MKQMDMHMHSYYSDGCKDIKQLAQEVEEKGLSLFSLTDHDCIDGSKEMASIMKDKAITFVAGVEISSTFEKKEFHLLVYDYDDKNQDFLDLLASNIEVRSHYDEDLINALIAEDTPGVSYESFKAYIDDPYEGGWVSINYLRSIGLVNDFTDYLKLSNCLAKMIFADPKHVIEVAHKCGGKVILAHPSSNERGGLSKRVLDTFLSYGIDGLECYSPYHRSEDEVNYYLDYCKENNLIVSGGSDYHGGSIGREMGQPSVYSRMANYDFFLEISK